MSEKPVVSGAQIILSVFSVFGLCESVFRAFPVAGEQKLAFTTLSGQC